MVMEQAAMLVKTGFLPPTIKNPEQAVAIMMKGRELGVPPMYALSNIAVISGKPACTAELMLALLYRDHGDGALQVTETTATRCVAAYKRRTWAAPRSLAFTIEDAQRAGLQGGNWSKYPAAMLRARCISAVARMAFPDSIGGMYTPEELGATTHGETGEIVGAAAPAAPETAVRPAPPDEPEPGEGPVPVSPMAVATQREPEADVDAPRDGEFEAPTKQQLETLAKLGKLTGDEVDPAGMSKADVGFQIARLSEAAYSAKRRQEAGR